MAEAREHDIVIFGATGFTGGLIAEYFARHVPLDRVRWALAGRSRDKLLAVRARLAEIAPATERVPLLEADSSQPASTRALAESTRVVVSTVGPFIHFGESLVAACAAAGTDYVDSTGEPEFVKLTLRKYDEEARKSGAVLVSCCGVDSIPADLGAYFTMRTLKPSGPVDLEGHFSFRGKPSGGTWRSALEALRDAPRHLSDQRSVPEASAGRKLAHAPLAIRRSGKTYLAPLLTIDSQIVLRSAAELPFYGPDFRYGHYVALPGLTGLVGFGLGGLAMVGLAQLDLTRNWLAGLVEAGQGPDEEQRAKGWFKLDFVARHAGKELRTQVSGGDPGYTETAKMMAEAALALAEDRERLPARPGVCTSAIAFGDVLVERLQRAGIVFKVVSE